MKIHRLIVLLLASILVLGAPSALAGEGNHKNDGTTASGEGCRGHGPDKEENPGKGHDRSCDDGGTTSPDDGGTKGGTDADDDPGSAGKDHPHGGPPGQDPANEQPSGGSPGPPAGNGQPPGQTIPGTFTLDVTVDNVVAQVGTTLTYQITLTNTASQAAAVTVQNAVPQEVDFVSATHDPAVSGGSIQWSLTDLAPGSVTTLTWTGRVARAGDLDALNVVTIASAGEDVTVETHTYLASVQGLRLQRSATDPDWGTHEERRVVFRAAPPHAGETAGASTGGSAQLPQTGVPALEVALIAILMLLGGLVLLGRGKRVAAAAMMVVLVMAACTSEPPVEPPLERNDASSDEESDDEEGDQVLGTRVGKDDEEEGAEDGATAGGTEDSEAADEGTEDTEEAADDPGEELVKEVVLVQVPNEAPDPEALGSANGLNTVSLTWDEPTRSIGTATSSRFFQSGSPIDLLSSVSDAGDGIGTTVTLTNITDDERLLVRGHLVLTVTGAGGTVVELTSPAIDTVLDPNDEVSTDFVLALPTGSYVIDSSFVAS